MILLGSMQWHVWLRHCWIRSEGCGFYSQWCHWYFSLT